MSTSRSSSRPNSQQHDTTFGEHKSTEEYSISKTVAEWITGQMHKGGCSECTLRLGLYSGNPGTLQVSKLTLASCSPVFEAMFFGPMADETDAAVDIPDISRETFSRLLDFVQDNEFDIIGMDDDDIWDLLYASNKYLIQAISSRCIERLMSNVSAKNALKFYGKAFTYGMDDMERECLAVIDDQATRVFSQKDFLELDEAVVVNLLRRPTLEVSELQLFLAALRWAKQAARGTVWSVSDTIRPLLSCLRLEALSPDDLIQHVIPAQVLTYKDQARLLVLCLQKLLPSPLTTETRRSSCSVVCKRASTAASVSGADSPGRNHYLWFRINTNRDPDHSVILFTGLRVMSPDAGPNKRAGSSFGYTTKMDVQLTLTRGAVENTSGQAVKVFEEDGAIAEVKQRRVDFPFDLELPRPVALDAATFYLIQLKLSEWKLPKYHNSLAKSPVVKCQGLEVEFYSDPRSTFTTAEGGFIPDLYFSVSFLSDEPTQVERKDDQQGHS